MVASPPTPGARGGAEGAVRVERHGDGVALVTMDRPKPNALSVPALWKLRHAVAEEALAAATRLAAAAATRVMAEGIERPLDEAPALETSAAAAVAHTEDARTGVFSFLGHGPGRARFAER